MPCKLPRSMNFWKISPADYIQLWALLIFMAPTIETVQSIVLIVNYALLTNDKFIIIDKPTTLKFSIL